MTSLLTILDMSDYIIRTRAKMTRNYALFLRGGQRVAAAVGGGGALHNLVGFIMFPLRFSLLKRTDLIPVTTYD